MMQQREVEALARVVASHQSPNRWHDDATCRDLSLDDFFADEPTRRARAACRACPVLVDCLAEEVGFTVDGLHGYRAGLEAPARRQVISAANGLVKDDREERMRRAVRAVASGASV